MRRVFAVSLACLLSATLAAQQPYKLPPQVIVDILDTPPLPAASVSPDRQWLLLLEQRSMPTIAELAQPMLRLAGNRINPRTTGPQLPGPITALVLTRVADGSERRIAVPAPAALSFISWSPDSRSIAFVQTRDSGLALWVADAATGQTRALTGPVLSATSGPPCQWMPSAAKLLCEFVPDDRGPAPVAPQTPVGPTKQETSGHAAPAPTYEDLLKSANDERLFDYYFTAQLALVDAATGARTPVGAPAIFDRVYVAPGGARHHLASRRPHDTRVGRGTRRRRPTQASRPSRPSADAGRAVRRRADRARPARQALRRHPLGRSRRRPARGVRSRAPLDQDVDRRWDEGPSPAVRPQRRG